MNQYVTVCFVLCVVAVNSQIQQQLPSFPFRPGTRRGCYRRTLDWYTSEQFNLPPVQNGNSVTYYFNCTVRLPTASECTGGCNSSHKLIIKPWISAPQSCECCKAHAVRRITPRYASCRYVIRFINGCLQTPISSGIAFGHPNLAQYDYYVMDQCRCDACEGGIGRKKRETAEGATGLKETVGSESAIDDYPRQPMMRPAAATAEEQSKILREIPSSAQICREKEEAVKEILGFRPRA